MTLRVLALAFAAFAVVGPWLDPYWLNVFDKMFLNALFGVSIWPLFVVGRLSLGHAAFYGIGAYGVSVLMLEWHWSFWAALPITLGAGALFAVLLGLPTLRLAGAYFALGTFAFGEIVRSIFQRFEVPFGGAQGLFSIPAPQAVAIPGVFQLAFSSGHGLYYLLLTALAAFSLLYHRYVESGVGLRLRAISSAEQLAQATGVSVRAYRLATFVVCALGAVVAGALYAAMAHYIEPNLFGSFRSIDAQAYVIVGGQASVLGPLLGAAFLSLLGEALGLAREAGPIITALAMLAAVFFVRGGLLGWLSASGQLANRALRATRGRYGTHTSR